VTGGGRKEGEMEWAEKKKKKRQRALEMYGYNWKKVRKDGTR
jgi:hypothetical protein